MGSRTKATILFEQFCQRARIPSTSIEPEAARDQQCGSYLLDPPPDHVVAVVTQFDLQPQERDSVPQLRDHHWSAPLGDPQGHRVHEAIADRAAQLKEVSRGAFPALLVLFNNTGVVGLNTHRLALRSAMFRIEFSSIDPAYGLWQIVGPAVRVPGSKRSVGPDASGSLSAIAVLRYLEKAGLRLDVYHNHFAHVPLPSDWHRSPVLRHFRIDPEPDLQCPDWHEID